MIMTYTLKLLGEWTPLLTSLKREPKLLSFWISLPRSPWLLEVKTHGQVKNSNPLVDSTSTKRTGISLGKNFTCQSTAYSCSRRKPREIQTIMTSWTFPVPCLLAPKAQKGIDKGKKSTRFWELCIVGWKYTWAQKSTWKLERTHLSCFHFSLAI